jgi:hypothetical protein
VLVYRAGKAAFGLPVTALACNARYWRARLPSMVGVRWTARQPRRNRAEVHTRWTLAAAAVGLPLAGGDFRGPAVPATPPNCWGRTIEPAGVPFAGPSVLG